MKKRGRPLTTPPWWEGTARSWQAVSPAERKRLRALQTRREAEWERVDGATPLASLPASCVAARTVSHDGSGPRALHELLRACGVWDLAMELLRDVCDWC